MAITKITTNSLADSAVTSAKLANSISIGTLAVTGNLTVDTNTFFVNAANNTVGIGTTSPSNALHVVSSDGVRIDVGYPAGALNVGADVNATTRTSNVRKLASFVAPEYTNTRTVEFFNFDSGSSSSVTVSFGGRSGGSQYAATQLNFLTAANTSTTGGTVVMTINSSQMVGIGTTSPSAKLHTIATTEQLRVGYDASNYASVTVSSAGLVTLDAVGASAGFVLADPVKATAQPVLSAMADTHVITKGVADIGYGQKTYHTISTTSTTILASYDTLFTRSLPIGNYRFEYRVWVKNNEVSANISPRIGFATSSGTISVDAIRENRYNQGSFLSACFRNATSANHDGGNLTVGSPNFTEGSMAMFGFINVTAAAVVLFRFTHNGSAPTNPTTVEGHLVLESLTAS